MLATFLALKAYSVSASNAAFRFLFSPQFPLPSRETPLSFPAWPSVLGFSKVQQGGGASELHSPEGSTCALGLASYCHLEAV